MGIPKSRIRVPKKSDILLCIMLFLLQSLCFVSKRSDSGRVGYILDLEKLGLGSPKKVEFRSGTQKFWYPLHHYYSLIFLVLIHTEIVIRKFDLGIFSLGCITISIRRAEHFQFVSPQCELNSSYNCVFGVAFYNMCSSSSSCCISTVGAAAGAGGTFN